MLEKAEGESEGVGEKEKRGNEREEEEKTDRQQAVTFVPQREGLV